MNCNHTLSDKETECADGYCPICLKERVKELEEGIRKFRDNIDDFYLDDLYKLLSPESKP